MPLTQLQALALAYFAEHSPTGAGELALHLGIDVELAQRLCDELEAEGMLDTDG